MEDKSENKNVSQPRASISGDTVPVNVREALGVTTTAQQLPPLKPAFPEAFKGSTDDDVIKWLDRQTSNYAPLSKADLEKLRKKQRAERIVGGVADAARAISNLIATHNYAPNMWDGRNKMSAKSQARFDKEEAERKAKDEQWFNYALTKAKLKNGQKQEQWRQQQQEIALQIKINEDARRQAKAEYDAEMADIDMDIKLGKYTTAQELAGLKKRKAEAEAKLAEAYAEHADAIALRRAKGSGSSRASSGGGNHRVKRINPQTGEVEYKGGFRESEARNFAATYADEGWVYVTTPKRSTNTVTTSGLQGRSTKTSTTTTDVSSPKVEIDWEE